MMATPRANPSTILPSTRRGRSLGLTATSVGRQVRDAFQGAIALRQQRGGNEVTVRVRLPEQQRLSEFDIETMLITTPAGTFVPLSDIAEVEEEPRLHQYHPEGRAQDSHGEGKC